ncbi:MAG: DUF885 domain-containing protein [Erysipelotrichaceae bacterium]|nr:DUF885 domain-containing protein [Erysipelotrichaceae bacterium]
MKKLLVLLLTALMLVSCTQKQKPDEESLDKGKHYMELIENYEVRTKNQSNLNDDPEFDKFLDKVFVEAMESDFMTMHFNVTDYRKYGIEKPPVDLGELKYGFDEENFTYMEDQLNELQSFDFDKLSYRQQYDYEALEYSLYETLANLCYYQYSYLFSSGGNLADNIISNFTDYTFYDEESIEDYLTCLADFDRYFEDAMEYTKQQKKAGFLMMDEWVDYTIEVCDDTLNKTEDNEYIASFDRRMKEIDFISESQKQDYMARNKELVLNEVLPSYEKLRDEIKNYYSKKDMDSFLMGKQNKDYARLTYYLNGSTNKNLDTVFQELQDNMSLLEAELLSCLYDEDLYNEFIEYYSYAPGVFSLSPKESLEFLRQNLNAYYPDLGDVDYTVDELDPDTASDNVVAYYWPSPIDNSNQNIIRTNPNNMADGLDAYNTLAHEGFPGHLYQHVYYYRTNPHNFRSAIGFMGYTEGWAVNASMYAFMFSGIPHESVAKGLFYLWDYYFLMYSIIDMGMNLYDWSREDVYKFFSEEYLLLDLYQIDESWMNMIIDYIVERQGGFIPYGVGLSSFMTLCEETQKKMGDSFDYVSYHETLMKNGPLPFNILQGAVDEYIASK